MAPNARSDRYEPLPGVIEIPGFLYRKLSPRGRRAAQFVAAALVVALAAGIVFGLPAITTTKEERAAAERSAVAKRRAERQAQLVTTSSSPAASTPTSSSGPGWTR